MFKNSNLSDDLALGMENILSGQVSKDNDIELEKQALKKELSESIETISDFNVRAAEVLKSVLKNISG